VRRIQGKVWGETWPVFFRNNVEIHRIKVKAGGYCSTHRHRAKFNQFCVLSGILDVFVAKADYDLTDRTSLHHGETMTVAPGEFHHFKAVEDTDALEVYWTELREDDIERQTVGGME